MPRAGAMFKARLGAWNFKLYHYPILHAFGNSSDGQTPFGGMAQINNVLYGTTQNGGGNGVGTVFAFDPANGTETVLYSFQDSQTDGRSPEADFLAVNHVLYSTTNRGGTNDAGTVFSFNVNTSTERVLSSNIQGGYDVNNGLVCVDHALFGTQPEGGAHGFGFIYNVVLSSTFCPGTNAH